MRSVAVASSAPNSRSLEMLGSACSRPLTVVVENCCRHLVQHMPVPPCRNWRCSAAFAIVPRLGTAIMATLDLFSMVVLRYGCASDRVIPNDCCDDCGIGRNFGCDYVDRFGHFCRVCDPVSAGNYRENSRRDSENCG